MAQANKHFISIDEYIATFSPEIQARLNEVRKVVHEIAPDAVETISYNMPAFKLNGHGMVYFSAYKKHLSIYPFPAGVEEFEQAAEGYDTSGRGTVQFPYEKPIPLELLKKIVKFRLQECLTAEDKN